MAEFDSNGEPREEYLMLSGEGVQFMTDDDREVLRQMATELVGGRAVGYSVVVGREIHDFEPAPDHEPIPAGLTEFNQFGRENGYAEHKGRQVWYSLGGVSYAEKIGRIPRGKYPPVMYVGETPLGLDKRPVEMHSVCRRLVATECDREMWRMTPSQMNFLKHMTNAYVDPEEPFEVEPPKPV